MLKLICLLLLFTSLRGENLNYGIDAKKEGLLPIKSMAIFSERCSGSNYLKQLLSENLGIELTHEFGHKHFSPWFDYPISQNKGFKRAYTFIRNEETLFFILFRDPYDWLRSFCLQPFHVDPKVGQLPFEVFIHTPWVIENELKELFGPLVDIDPKTCLPFPTVMDLRTAKIRNMLQIQDRVSNVYILNYEMVRDHPKEVIEEIAAIFGFIPKKLFKDIKYHSYDKYKKQPYKKKKYQRINKKDLYFINEHLDAELEASIGYQLTYNPDEID